MSGRPTLLQVLRTVRYVRPAQAVAQLRHLVAPGYRIAQLHEAPALAASRPVVPFLAPGRHASLASSHPGAPEGEAEIRVRLIDRCVGFRGAVDWDHRQEGSLWAYHLHQFDHARDPRVSAELRTRLVLDWIESHREGVGWDPHPTSHRILSWGKLLLMPGALALDTAGETAVRLSLASQAETLSRNLEHRLQANHLFTNLVAVVFAGILFEGREADGWIAQDEAFLAELRDQVHPDGAHEERSPMYHALLLEQVLDLLNLSRSSSRASRRLLDALTDAASRMCGALELFTLPDGEIALFADSAFEVAPPAASLADYATALGVAVVRPEQPGYLPYGGYVRLADARMELLASVAGPAPDHMPGHAHCDALSFELCVDGERAVTDTGVFEYLPGELRDAARATRSHATLEIEGREQAELWAAHRVGGRPRVAVHDLAPGTACEASCEGWSSGGAVHWRRFELEDGVLEIHDRIEGGPRAARLTLPLAVGASARLVGEPAGVDGLVLQLAGGARVQVDLPAGVSWRLEVADAFPAFGRRERRFQLVGESESFESGTWRFQPG